MGMEEQIEALSLQAAYQFAAEHGLDREAEEIRTIPINCRLKTKSSVRRGYIVDLLEKHNLFDIFKDQHWAYGSTSAGEQTRKQYLFLKARHDDFLAGEKPHLLHNLVKSSPHHVKDSFSEHF